MANLIIQENGVARTRPAVTGEEITIKTPCGCSDVTGVQINGVAFPFYDASGNSLADMTGLFAKDSLIRVLIDADKRRAYILNADTNAYLEAQLASKAPAGFGLGTHSKSITDWNTAMTNGWYFDNALGTEEKHSPFIGTWTFGYVCTNSSGSDLTQIAFARLHYSGGYDWYEKRRNYSADAKAWTEWEWVNPPMSGTTEYRTTERINGKAVYKRNNGGIIEYRLDGETEWKSYANAVGGIEECPVYLTYYVSNSTGNDETGDGSESAPFKTLNRVFNHLSGKAANSVTIKMAPEEYSDTVYISGYSYRLNIARLEITRWGDSGYIRLPYLYLSGLDIVVVYYCEFYGTTVGHGRAFMAETCRDVTVVDCRSVSDTLNISSEYKVFAAFSFYACPDARVYRCEISNKFEAIRSRGSMVSVSSCTGTGNSIAYQGGTGQGTGGGIIYNCDSNTIEGDESVAFGGVIIHSPDMYDGIILGRYYTTTIPASGWLNRGGDEGYYQQVSISGIKYRDDPVIGLVCTGTVATDRLLKEDWNKISRIDCGHGLITVYAYDEVPTVNLPIRVTCVR